MFNKTTSLSFIAYGTILNDETLEKYQHLQKRMIKISNKNINRFYHYSEDVYIHVLKGIVLLLVNKDSHIENVERFVIHRITKIKKGIYFNFITLSTNARVNIMHDSNSKKSMFHLKDVISYPKILPSFQVKEIFAYYYQVRNINYEFKGEAHLYWELTYVDNGTLETTINDTTFVLNNFDLILYAPKQFHTQRTLSDKSCSYLTVMFDMNISDYATIANRVFHCQNDLFGALNNFIRASDAPERQFNTDLLICYLQEFVVKLLQYDTIDSPTISIVAVHQKFENELLNEIIFYINENICKPLTIEEICYKFSVSRSSLQTIFKENLNAAPKYYINELKLAKSKLLIKEQKYTISEISVLLGFSSIHYFSRKFKLRYNLSPTEYAKSIYN